MSSYVKRKITMSFGLSRQFFNLVKLKFIEMKNINFIIILHKNYNKVALTLYCNYKCI